MSRQLLVAALAAATACSTRVDSTNAFDPNAPPAQQAKASVHGTLVAPTLDTPAGIVLTVSTNNAIAGQATAGADGSFVFANLTPGAYVLQTAPTGFAPLALPLSLQPGDNVDLKTVTLTPLVAADVATLSGTATLTGAADSSGILVEAVGRSYTTTTASTGAWQLQVVPGTYSLRFSHKDFLPVTVDSITVAKGESKQLAAVPLTANPASIDGTVTAEVAAGGTAPLAGASVTLDGTSILAISDVNGHFHLTGVPAGTYVVRALKGGFADATATIAALSGGEARTLTTPLNLALLRGALSGTIALQDNALDASGVIVSVTGTTLSQTTGSDGRFSFSGLVATTYEVRARKDGYVAQVIAAAAAVPANGTDDLGTVTLQPNPAQVLGHVDAENTSGGQDPLAGATVSVDGTSISAITNATGDFSLGGIPVGSYVVRVTKAGYATATQPVLNLTGGEVRTLSPFFVTLTRGALAGTVLLPDSSDASGIIVELTGTSRAVVTSQSGAFELDAVLTGTYEVTARKDGYVRQVLASSATVLADSTRQLGTFTLVRQGGGVSLPAYTASRSVTLTLNSSTATGYLASEDPNFQNAALGDTLATTPHPYATSASFTLQDLDGLRQVYVIFFNNGSQAPPASAQTVLDRVAPANPSVQINGGAAYTNAAGGVVTLTLSAQDLPPASTPAAVVSGIAQMAIANDTTSLASASPIPFNRTLTWTLATPTSQGTKTVYAKFFDNAGLASAVASATIIYDTIKPASASITLSGPSGSTLWTTTSQVVATLSASDANGGAGNQNLFVKLANTSGLVGATYQPFQGSLVWLLPPGDGSKTVYAQFADPAGNESVVVNASITLDTAGPTSPAMTIVEGDGNENGYTKSTGVTLTLSALGAPVSADVSEDPSFSTGTLHVALPASPAFTLGGAGVRTLYARFFDAAGNASAVISRSVVVDQTAPLSLAPSFTPGSIVTGTTVKLIPPQAGQDLVQITGDVTAPSGFVSAAPGVPVTLTLTSGDAVKTLNVTWADLAGNTTALSPLTITLDSTPPAATNFSVTGKLADGTTSPTLAASASVTLDLTHASDATTSVALMKLSNRSDLSDASWQPYVNSAAYPWTLSAGDGAKTVYALFQDAAGNTTAAATSGSITVNGTAPTNGSLVLEGGAAQTKNTTVNLAISAVGAAEMAISQDNFSSGTTWVAYTTSASATFTGGDQVTKSVWIKFRNNTRIEGAAAKASIWWDHTAPSATGWGLALQGALGSGLGPSTQLTSSTSITALLTPPSTGAGDVAAVAFAQPATASCTGAFGATPSFVPYSSGVPLTLAAGDGTKYVCVCFEDGAGNFNTASAVLASIVLDTTLPSTAAFTVNGTHVNGTADTALTATPLVSLSFTAESDATSGLAAMKVSNRSDLADAAWQPFATKLSWSLTPGDGAKTVYALFRDAAGNASSTAVTGAITLDTTGPGAPTLAVQGNGYSNSTTVHLTLGADGTDQSVTVSENPSLTGGTPYTKPYGSSPSFTVGGSGTRVLYAQYFDAAGNASALVSASVTVILPSQAPAALPSTLNPSGYTTSAGIQLIPPNAGQATLSITGDLTAPTGSVSAPAGQPINVTLTSAEGTKNLAVTYADLAGNTTAAPALSIVYDHTAPAAVNFTVAGREADGTAVSGSSANVSNNAVTLDFHLQTDAASGIAAMKISNLSNLSDAVWQPFSNSTAVPWTLPDGDGAKTVYALFKDNAGNANTVAVTGAINLLQTPPSGSSLVIDSGATVTNNRTATLAISSTGAAEMNLSADGFTTSTGWIPYATSYNTLDLLAGGANANVTKQVSVAVKFRNAARVEGGSTSASILYDRVAPPAGSIALQGSLGNSTPSSTLTTSLAVIATVTNASTDVVQMAFAQSGACSTAFGTPVWQPYAPNATVVLTGGEGAKTICVIFRDAAGNVSPIDATTANASITLDSTPPSNPIFLTPTTNSFTKLTQAAATFSSVTDSRSGAVVQTQCLGGQFTSWTDCGAPLGVASTFTLQAGSNLLGVRARDDAYNYSGGSFIVVTSEPTAPLPPTISNIGTNADSVTISWLPSPSSTAIGYRVNYGFSPNDTSGAGAAQGQSPIDVGGQLSVDLTGLTLGQTYYVSVLAYDAAGNVSDPSAQRIATPNRVGSRLLSSMGSQLGGVIQHGNYTYVLESQAVVQFDISANPAALIGRAIVPNVSLSTFFPSTANVCTVGGVTGECLYVTGTTLEGVVRGNNIQYPAGVYIVFFPNGGTVTDPVAGSIVASVNVPAIALSANSTGTALYALQLDSLRVYSLANVTQPVLTKTIPFPDGQLVGGITAGSADDNTYLAWIVPSSTPGQLALYVFDVNPTHAGSVTKLAAPVQTGGAALPIGPSDSTRDLMAAFANGAMYAVYGTKIPTTTDPTQTAYTLNIAKYTPGSGNYPQPQYSASIYPVNGNTGSEWGFTGAAVPTSSTTARLYFPAFVNGTQRLDQLLDNGSSLSLVSGTTFPSFNGGQTLSASTSGGFDRIIVMEPSSNFEQKVDRWSAGPGSVAGNSSFSDSTGLVYAYGQGLLFAANNNLVRVIDVSNPLLPRTISQYTRGLPAGQSLQKLLVDGHRVFAASTGATVDVLTFAADGTITGSSETATMSGTNPQIGAMAVSGKYLFVAAGQTISVFDSTVGGVVGPLASITTSTGTITGLDVRNRTLYAVDSTGIFQTFTFSTSPGPSLSALSGMISPPAQFGSHTVNGLSVAGTKAAVSDLTHAMVVDVSAPSAPFYEGPSNTQAVYSVASPVRWQGGYLVGAGPGDGPRYVAYGYDGATKLASASIDGASPFSQCGTNYGHVMQSDVNGPITYQACNNNGLQIASPLAPSRALLSKVWDGTFFSHQSMALASDGLYVMFGSPTLSANTPGLLLQDDSMLTLEVSPGPVATETGINPAAMTLTQNRSGWFELTVGGTLVVRDASTISPNGTPMAQLTSLSALASGNIPFYTPPVTDGDTLYVPYVDTTGNTSGFQVWDVRDPATMSAASRLTTYVGGAWRPQETVHSRSSTYGYPRAALERHRLFLSQNLAGGANSQATAQIGIFDVSTPGTPTSAGAITFPSTQYDATGMTAFGLGDVAVSGRYVFYTYKRFDLTDSLTFGLGVLRLDPTRSSVQAVLLGPPPATGSGGAWGKYESYQPISGVTVAGDLLYTRFGFAGLGIFDLTPTWKSGLPPAFLVSSGTTGTSGNGSFDPFQEQFPPVLLEGPFAHVLDDRFETFDLR